MIHYTPEGAIGLVGLNWSVNWRPLWFRVFWIWYDVPTRRLTRWYFRFRIHLKPHCIWQQGSGSVIEDWLFETQHVILSQARYKELSDAERNTDKKTFPVVAV